MANTSQAGLLLIKTDGNENPVLVHFSSLARGSRLIGDAGKGFLFVLEGTDSSKATAHGIIPDQFFAITTSRGHINYRILSNNATPIEIVEQAKDDKYSSSSHEVGYIIFEPTLFQDCVSSFPFP